MRKKVEVVRVVPFIQDIVSSIPSDERIAQMSEDRDLDEQGYFEFHKYRFAQTIARIGEQPCKVLDVGVFPGHLGLFLEQRGFDVSGVSLGEGTVFEKRMNFLQSKGLDVSVMDIQKEALPFSDNTFDLVLFLEILEHLIYHPLKAFQEMARVLKPGGRIICETPNWSSFGNRVLSLQGKNPLDIDCFYREWPFTGHVRLFTGDEISDLMREAKLEILSVEGDNVWGHTGRTANFPAPRWFWRKFISILQSVNPLLKDNVIVQARKPIE